MEFDVIAPGSVVSKHRGFLLRQDNWNDYNFRTQYQLYWNGGDQPELIGDVKILRKGQADSDPLQLAQGRIGPLSEDFCSIGQGLDFYERLARLGPEVSDVALKGLRDIVFDPTHANGFMDEFGWRRSLFRYISYDDDFINVARSLITRDFTALGSVDLTITFNVNGWDNPLRLDFSTPGGGDDFFDHGDIGTQLPGRVVVLVGRNGSGKSTILARLARIVHASPSERQFPELTSLGSIEPSGVGFTRVVAISYSAFDSFPPPGGSADERQRVAAEIRQGTGRYMFCGLRDMALEMEDMGGQLQAGERLASNRVKPLHQMTTEFVEAIDRIRQAGRVELLRKASAAVFRDPSLYVGDGSGVGIDKFIGEDAAEQFHWLSTGHKLVLHTIVSLVSHLESRSIVLFDEPETHLHPPLLAALMHALRIIVEKLDSFAVVATHSPVVVQETLARHVHKVVRAGETAKIVPAEIETFGESVGAISNEVFSLAGSTTDYHGVLRELVKRYDNIDAIEALFQEGMSSQARAFAMSLYATGEAR